jgi:putative DNA-invertase from lambdoid prophage Rac
MKMDKAVIYARVSTGEQETQNQIDALLKWASTKELLITAVYQESESAWKDGHQGAFAELMEDATHYRFDYVLVWALDRVSREGPLAVLQIIDRLKKSGVKLLSYQESWTEAPGELGDLLYSLTAWVSRMESKRLSERTRAGQARARKDGKHMGRPPGKKDKKKRHRRTKAEIVAGRKLAL